MLQILYKGRLKPQKAIYAHLFCWSIFILYEISVTALIVNALQPFLYYLLFYSLNICLFYFHSLVVLQNRPYSTLVNLWRIPLLIIIELLLYFFLYFLIGLFLRFLINEKLTLEFVDKRYLLTSFYRGIYFMLLSTGYYFLVSYNQKKQKELTQTIENEKLKNELLQAEQDFLRAQINPHLLFNTLNFIKYAAKKKPEEANEAIMRLSGIMSFALENNTTTIPIRKEIDQVENIIRLNQLRYNHTLLINYTTDIHNFETPVIPILLLTLVENVFKHGDLTNTEYPVQIRVETTDEYLLFITTNVPNGSRALRSDHTGLANIKSRLDHFYKENYRFSFGMEGNIFKVEIKIRMNDSVIIN